MVEPLGPMVEPLCHMVEPPGAMVGPLGQMVEPQGPMAEPLGAVVEPRGPMAEPLGAVVEPLWSMVEPLCQMVEPLCAMVEPQGPVVEPLWSIPGHAHDGHCVGKRVRSLAPCDDAYVRSAKCALISAQKRPKRPNAQSPNRPPARARARVCVAH